MNTELQKEANHIQVKLASGTIEVDVNTLEKMKLAMLSFFGKPEADFPAQYLELRDYLRQELESSVCWINEGLAWVGAWRLEGQGNHLELVRYPPPEQGAYILHASLEQRGSEWEVIAFDHEREFGPD